MSVLMVGTNDADFVPDHFIEKVVISSAMLIGAMVMSTIIGNISDIIANANPGKTARKQAEGLVRCLPPVALSCGCVRSLQLCLYQRVLCCCRRP